MITIKLVTDPKDTDAVAEALRDIANQVETQGIAWLTNTKVFSAEGVFLGQLAVQAESESA
jgi:hypothetical protein